LSARARGQATYPTIHRASNASDDLDPAKAKVTGGTSTDAQNDKDNVSVGIYDFEGGKLRWARQQTRRGRTTQGF